jgi:hypothetical protein
LEARKDPGQKTPLHIACCALEDAHASVVKQLLGAGANPRAEASWGTLPLSIAYDAVVRETRLLCDQKPTEGHRTSTLYPICCRFPAAIDIMVELLKYLNPADIKDEAHRHQIKETFIFRNIDDPENTPGAHLQEELQEQRKFALLSSDEEIYNSIRYFFNAKQERHPDPLKNPEQTLLR